MLLYICLIFLLCNTIFANKNITIIKRWEIPSLYDQATNFKQLSILKYPDNYTLVSIHSNKALINNPLKQDGESRVKYKKSQDGIYMNAKTFQKFYLAATNEKRFERFHDEEDEIIIYKHYDGTKPFHLIVRREFISDDDKLIYRGIHLDAIEYKFLVSHASEIMKDVGV